MKTVILTGGLGTRLSEETIRKPKPMVEIGDKPILWHIMKLYAAHGFGEFGVALGYKADVVKHFFLNYYHLHSDITVDLANGNVSVQAEHAAPREDWRVTLVDTGLHTQTGGRIKRMHRWVGNGTFMMTYGDGLADVDISSLVAFHKQHGKLATVLAVRPPSRFGGLDLDGDGRVTRFAEKPQLAEGWINGGFFVLEPQVLDYIDSDETSWESTPVERLAAEGQLVAYRHHGFWQCMDTLRDVRLLESLWNSGAAPWKVWN